ncbi:MAG TPA: non-canonical purine NTP diphosphatase [Chryseosolibacter sp.]
MRLCFATNNKHKIQEVAFAIKNKITILSLNDIGCFEELPETRDTLEGNSLQKAEYVYNNFSIPCFADDTGLEVPVLNNAPGVYSARYAGEHKNSDDNINLLLKNLSGISDRRAQFRTIITLIGLDKIYTFEGIVKGTITTERKGTAGFGYDPVFIPEGHTKSFGEMSLEEKHQLSHRAIAVSKLTDFLVKRGIE